MSVAFQAFQGTPLQVRRYGTGAVPAFPGRLPCSLRHAFVVRDQDAVSRRLDLFYRDQTAVEHPMAVRAQHRHVIQGVGSACRARDDMRYVTGGFVPAAQRALVKEAGPYCVPERDVGTIHAVTRAPGAHGLGLRLLTAFRAAVNRGAPRITQGTEPDPDAHAGEADPELSGQGRLCFPGIVPATALGQDFLGQLLRRAVRPGRADLRWQVLSWLAAVGTRCGQAFIAWPGRMLFLILGRARRAAELPGFTVLQAPDPLDGAIALQALLAGYELAPGQAARLTAVLRAITSYLTSAPWNRFSAVNARFTRDYFWMSAHSTSICGGSQ